MSRVLAALLSLQEGNITYHSDGICDNLSEFIEVDSRYAVSKVLKEKWEEYTGDESFPLPGGRWMYMDTYYNGDQWDKHTEYGQLRYEALQILIDNHELLERYL